MRSPGKLAVPFLIWITYRPHLSPSLKHPESFANEKHLQTQDLLEALGVDSAKVPKLRLALEHYSLDHEEWLSNRGNHTKWNPLRVKRLLATKTITTDEWLKKAVELGDKLGVETADIGLPALHSLHLLLKKKVDEKLGAHAKWVKAAAKGLAAERLAAANTRVDTAEQELDAADIRTEGATLEDSNGQTHADPAHEEWLVIPLRNKRALLDKETGRRRGNAAKPEEEVCRETRFDWRERNPKSGETGFTNDSPTEGAAVVVPRWLPPHPRRFPAASGAPQTSPATDPYSGHTEPCSSSSATQLAHYHIQYFSFDKAVLGIALWLRLSRPERWPLRMETRAPFCTANRRHRANSLPLSDPANYICIVVDQPAHSDIQYFRPSQLTTTFRTYPSTKPISWLKLSRPERRPFRKPTRAPCSSANYPCPTAGPEQPAHGGRGHGGVERCAAVLVALFREGGGARGQLPLGRGPVVVIALPPRRQCGRPGDTQLELPFLL
ncbi:hypothetical protein FN846DRAFT_889646 [Sphaerosporella brunnea]|uniref:Uncharacterized protein n=1 Tax=Sphaerosporella brunnea TaxID=1250544 RepID=A0A5J5EYH5_9PEZI|nr:hypothetical protein FN846DRAFT_889646 [Sphaerosporella brunnea]